MASLASTLRKEIQRLARKEVRVQTGRTKQAVAQYRRDIAELKRRLREQQKTIERLQQQEPGPGDEVTDVDVPRKAVRFSAKSVRSQRRRLGLSAKDYAELVGVSPLTVYNWEHGRVRPQKAQLAALAALRGIGKREALARLEASRLKQEQAAAGTRKASRK